jgi:hypothetical protein
VKATGLRRAHPTKRGLVLFRALRHQSASEGTQNPRLQKLPRRSLAAGEFFCWPPAQAHRSRPNLLLRFTQVIGFSAQSRRLRMFLPSEDASKTRLPPGHRRGSFFVGRRGQKLSSSRPPPPDSRHHQRLPHLQARRMIAGFTLSYSRSLRLLRSKEFGWWRPALARDRGTASPRPPGFVRGSSPEPYRIVGTSRIIRDDRKV